jgi:hypothetical protein
MKARIAVAMAVGVVLIGVLGWPLAHQSEPLEAIRAGSVGPSGFLVLAAIAFAAGALASLASKPHGKELGVLAVPMGLAVWAVRTGSVATLMQANPTSQQRQAVFAAMKWEPLLWLAIVAAGYAGVLAVHRIRCGRTRNAGNPTKLELNAFLGAGIAIIGTVFIAHFFVGRFAQDIKAYDSNFGFAMAQPAIGQVAFGVIAAFAAAGFAVKTFLDGSYIWPTLATALVTAFAIAACLKGDIPQKMAEMWPAVFFPHPSLSVLPLQMVAFGSLGSVIGYWLAVRYGYWRKHEMA